LSSSPRTDGPSTVVAATVITKAVDFGGKVFDVLLFAYSAKREFADLDAAIGRVIANSPRTDVLKLNQVKNDIDGACGGR
jgi:hypothetical protein